MALTALKKLGRSVHPLGTPPVREGRLPMAGFHSACSAALAPLHWPTLSPPPTPAAYTKDTRARTDEYGS